VALSFDCTAKANRDDMIRVAGSCRERVVITSDRIATNGAGRDWTNRTDEKLLSDFSLILRFSD